MSVGVAENKRRSKTDQKRSLIKLTEAQAVLAFGVILALGALVGAIYLFQASRIATVGRQVQTLQNDLDNIKRENAELDRGIAEAQSLETLQEAALRMGFVRTGPVNIEYLVIPDFPGAMAQTLTPEPTPLPVPPDSISEAVWLAIKASISNLVRGESQ